MTYTEIIVPTEQKPTHVFINTTSVEVEFKACPLHKHNMTEVQIITSGVAKFDIDGNKINATDFEMVVIPNNTYHQRLESGEVTKVIAFQTDANINSFQKIPLKKCLVQELKNEIATLNLTGVSEKLPYYFGLILSEFSPISKNTVTSVQDRNFLISEYMSLNYDKDITLADVAKILNLSEKQSERIIKQYTGKNFRKLLAGYRIDAAKILIKNGELTLAQVAEKVGYKSYSGFWKAYNK